jgi:endogenous inhibitor of DNA gyrase (YacG/DUF329 family)
MSIFDKPFRTLAEKVPTMRTALKRAEASQCPMCAEHVTTETFDGLPPDYKAEFRISGMCPACQDKVFKPQQH